MKMMIKFIKDNKLKSILNNAIKSFLFKILFGVLNFVSIPLTLAYLGTYNFGIYSTIYSVLIWVEILDFGFSQGLRNNVTENISTGNFEQVRRFISTALFSTLIISTVIFFVFLLSLNLVDWGQFFNVNDIEKDELKTLLVVLLIGILIRFNTSLFNKIYLATYKAYYVDLIQFIVKVIQIISLVILLNIALKSILYYAILQTTLMCIIPIAFGCFFFNKNRFLLPKISLIDKKSFNKLFVLSGKFFVIQISLIIINASNNLLISHFVSPEAVTDFQLVFALFNYLSIFTSVFMNPMWAEFTSAWILKKTDWLRGMIKRLTYYIFFFLTILVILVFASQFILKYWIGPDYHSSINLIILVAILVFFNNWTNIFDTFLNAIGMINVQMYLIVFGALINIPLAYFLSVYLNLRTEGVVLAGIISLTFTAISSPVQIIRTLYK